MEQKIYLILEMVMFIEAKNVHTLLDVVELWR